MVFHGFSTFSWPEALEKVLVMPPWPPLSPEAGRTPDAFEAMLRSQPQRQRLEGPAHKKSRQRGGQKASDRPSKGAFNGI